MLKKENTKILKNDLPCGDIKGLSITFLKTFSQQEKAELNLDKSNTAERLDFDKEDKKNLHGPVQIIDPNEDK